MARSSQDKSEADSGVKLLSFWRPSATDIEDEERKVRESDGKKVNMTLKNNIEGIILKWAHQVQLLR